MFVIGENIHIISKRVRTAIDERDKAFIQDLARRQVEKGAHMLDLNLGPMKKTGPETMEWIVNAVQDVVDVPLSLDTTNAAAVEAGLKLCKKKPLINSTTADPERLKVLFPLAAKYDANIIALTLRATGLPLSADARVEIVTDDLMPAAAEYGLPLENILFDPLVLTVNGTQEHAPEVVKATRIIKQLSDPPLKCVCGLSNVSNAVPKEMRPLVNRVYLVMLMGAGMDHAIVDPLDDELTKAIQSVESRDDSTVEGKLYLALYDAIANDEEFDPSIADMSDPVQSDIVKTIQILEFKTLYAHGYLRM
jgi:5-methyltetrahydrofolate corrinoid/iron sulfur protein methyltransferase